MSRMRVMLILAVVGAAVLALAALGGSASASDGTLDNDSFTWDVSEIWHTTSIVLAEEGYEPNWASLPTASFPGGPNTSVTYKLIGEGVTMHSELIPYRGGSFRTAVYYDLGNGMTFSKHPHPFLVVTSADTEPMAAKSYTWRAISFHGKYSDYAFTIEVVDGVSLAQETTTVSLQIGAGSTHEMDGPIGRPGPFVFTAYAGSRDLSTCDAMGTWDERIECLSDLGADEWRKDFLEQAPIEFDSDTGAFQLRVGFHEDSELAVPAGQTEPFVFTVAAANEKVFADHVVMSVAVTPSAFRYTSSAAVQLNAEVETRYVVTIPFPKGGTQPYSISLDKTLGVGWSYGDGSETYAGDSFEFVVDEQDDPNINQSWRTAYTFTITDGAGETATYSVTVHMSDNSE